MSERILKPNNIGNKRSRVYNDHVGNILNVQTFQDVVSLIQAGEKESAYLDYKKELDTSNNGKKELAKDATAFANADGGLILIGIEEDQGIPVDPPTKVALLINGRQKIEDWICQVLDTGISPKISYSIKVITERPGDDSGIISLAIFRSSSFPHMATSQDEYRYWARRGTIKVRAEEYEIREFYKQNQTMDEKLRQYLEKMGQLETLSPNQFGANRHSEQLVLFQNDNFKPLTGTLRAAFVHIPVFPERKLDLSQGSALRNWLDPNQRRYEPASRALFLPYQRIRRALDGVVFEDFWAGELHTVLRKYLSIHENGYMEFGYAPGWKIDDHVVIYLIQVVGRFWQYLNLLADFHHQSYLTSTAKVLLNLSGTAFKGSGLLGFAKGWRDSVAEFGITYHSDAFKKTEEPYLSIIEEINHNDWEARNVERIVRGFAARIGAAFGQESPRCFTRDTNEFDKQKFLEYEQ